MKEIVDRGGGVEGHEIIQFFALLTLLLSLVYCHFHDKTTLKEIILYNVYTASIIQLYIIQFCHFSLLVSMTRNI
jgi:hypothetical protein